MWDFWDFCLSAFLQLGHLPQMHDLLLPLFVNTARVKFDHLRLVILFFENLCMHPLLPVIEVNYILPVVLN